MSSDRVTSSGVTLTHRLTLDILGCLIDNADDCSVIDGGTFSFTSGEYIHYLDHLYSVLDCLDRLRDLELQPREAMQESMWDEYRTVQESVSTELRDYVKRQMRYQRQCGWSDEPILTDIRRSQEPRLSKMKTTVLESLYEEASWYAAVSSQGDWPTQAEEFARAKRLRDSFEAILDEFIRQM